MMCGVRPDGSWYHIVEFGDMITVDLAPLSAEDAERVVEAARVCHMNNCIDLFLDGTPLEVVDLLVSCGLMKKKATLWQKLWHGIRTKN